MKTQIKQFDLYGKRNHKYDFLINNNLKSIKWNELNPTEPNYFLTNKNFDEIKNYENGFKVDELFVVNGSGIKFRKDNLLIKNNYSLNDVKQMVDDILYLSSIELLKKYNFNETKDWKIKEQIDNFTNYDNIDFIKILYRPFDLRYSYFPYDKINKIIPRGDSRRNLMKHILSHDNLFLMSSRNSSHDFKNLLISKISIDIHTVSDQTYAFPLYLYPDQGEQGEIIEQTRTPNLNMEIVKEIEKVLGLEFRSEKEDIEGTFAPIDLLDYIYAVLHSPAYREKYKEFLKIDFPRVPYPNIKTFWKLVEIGKQIREIHLLESPIVEEYITKYPKDGSNIVEKPIYKDGNVYINSEQYFEGVPEVAWNFYIGGYQPAQKWLKDRKERELNFDDIRHYQKIIVALTETDRLMKEIDKVGVE